MPMLINPKTARSNESEKNFQLSMNLIQQPNKFTRISQKTNSKDNKSFIVFHNDNQDDELKQSMLYARKNSRKNKLAKVAIMDKEITPEEDNLNEVSTSARSNQPILQKAVFIHLPQPALMQAEITTDEEISEANASLWLQPVNLNNQSASSAGTADNYQRSLSALKSGGISKGWLIGGGLLAAVGVAVALAPNNTNETLPHSQYKDKKSQLDNIKNIHPNIRAHISALETELAHYKKLEEKLEEKSANKTPSCFHHNNIKVILDKHQDFLKKYVLTGLNDWFDDFISMMKSISKNLQEAIKKGHEEKIQEIIADWIESRIQSFKKVIEMLQPTLEAKEKEIDKLSKNMIVCHSSILNKKTQLNNQPSKEKKKRFNKTIFNKPENKTSSLFKMKQLSSKIKTPVHSNNHLSDEPSVPKLYFNYY